MFIHFSLLVKYLSFSYNNSLTLNKIFSQLSTLGPGKLSKSIFKPISSMYFLWSNLVKIIGLLKIKKSDYEEANNLIKKFVAVCKILCDKKLELKTKLQSLETN